MSFEDLHLPASLLRAIDELGFEKPTPIQREAIPPTLEGRDLLACAMTGSGKTAAFGLPILARLMAAKGRGVQGPRALIVAPTRELAAQTAQHIAELGRYTSLRCEAVFGGVSAGPQERAFRSGVEIIVATPGRLLDHVGTGVAKLGGVEILVLDEADRMLDMGFLPDIKRVLRAVPSERQTLFASATMPPPIANLANEILRQPLKIGVERTSKPAHGVSQRIYPVSEELKPYLLLALLEREEIPNAIVFTRTKHRANRLADILAKHRISSARIHGNRSQAQRTEALAKFKAGELKVLVATDIAARGIDVEALSHVVNLDVPNVAEDYVHRVGRTGRAEMTGEAWTFVSDDERSQLAAIERAVGKRIERATLPGFDYAMRPSERFEVPIGERIAEIRARKAAERQRAREKEERRAGGRGAAPARPAARHEPGRAAAPAHGQGARRSDQHGSPAAPVSNRPRRRRY